MSPSHGYASNSCSEILSVGMQWGEEIVNAMRLIALIIAAVASLAWCDRRRMRNMVLFFLQWCGGLVYIVVQSVQVLMIMNCWLSNHVKPFLYFVKFMELVSINLVSLGNLATTFAILQVVKSYRNYRRISNKDNQQLTLLALSVSLVATFFSFPWWNMMLATGTFIHVGNTSEAKSYWIHLSFIIIPGLAGAVGIGMLSFLVCWRREDLRQCCSLGRVRLYFVLSVLAAVNDLYFMVANILYFNINNDMSRRMALIAVGVRYNYISLTTIVFLVITMYKRDKAAIEGGTKVVEIPEESDTIVNIHGVSSRSGESSNLDNALQSAL